MTEPSSRKQTIFIVLAVGLVLLALRWPSIRDMIYGDQFPVPAFHWEHHWADAEKLAQEQNKPLLVVFSASWCPPCKAMKRSVWPDQKVGQVVQEGFVPLYVDVDEDEHAQKVSHYGVSSIPFVVVLDQDGKVRRQANFMSAKETVEFLSQP